MSRKKNVEKRFWSKVEKTEECWNWIAGSRGLGYGAFVYEGKTYNANRFVWFLTYGDWPKQFVLHKCNNRRCVNPAHLYEGTQKNNIDDMKKVGNFAYSPNGKLTKEQVKQIRKEYDRISNPSRKLAKKYNVGKSTILRVIRKESWLRVL